jgi:hypothetical protein
VDFYLFFPKTHSGGHAITLDDTEVEVILKAGSTAIKRKFKLKDMVCEGRLEM